MARYINADKLIERVNASCAFPNMGQDGYFLRDCIIDIISKQPTADVVEVKHGEWFLLDKCANEGVYCSVCYKKVYKIEYANQALRSQYCPNCGAKMDGGKVE